jgi:hypothetical protein
MVSGLKCLSSQADTPPPRLPRVRVFIDWIAAVLLISGNGSFRPDPD